ncbi:MAG: Gmad2 immunoglobulin-like domain-containing protein [Candidatus Nomurabacteria bacterium]|nr:Gmad2 immunoglobulin-like domain-containing protein [Candidatus Nomurabacteria bacterium]USN87345.1 MAG: Gmad2 immunoglobulin-like domain-containing protein [Candidatus Nomurabacteria bacterium]
MQCPDGTYVGRTGPNCEFVCPDEGSVTTKSEWEKKVDLIKVTSPLPNELISSPLVISGEARGFWFFEASFPIVLVDWDGKIIAEGYATAKDDWMTEDFVSFVSTLNFVSPYHISDPEFMRKGSLILKKDNPSDLPEHDNAIEIPVRFTSI